MHPVHSCTPLTRHKGNLRLNVRGTARRPARRLRAVCGLLALGTFATALLTSAARAGDVHWALNQNGDWNVAANWDTGVVPGSTSSTDDVYNDFTDAIIAFNTNATINSFLSQGAFNLFGGTLTGSQANSASTIQVNNVFTFNGGGLSNFTVNQGTGGSVVFTTNPNNYISNVIFKSDVKVNSGFTEVYGGGNQFNGVTTFSGGNARLYDGNAVLSIGSGGTLQGYGLLDQSYGGTTLTNNGTINANSSGNTLAINTSNLTGTGTFQATNGGVLSVGGFLNGTNITVLAGATAADGIVQIDGGGLGGSIGSTTGSGLSFTSNPNNNINNAVIGSGATLTFGSDGFAQVVNGNNVINGTMNMAGGTARLYNDSALLSIGSGGTLQGYGLLDQSYGGTTLTNNGTINANSSGNTLVLSSSNINGTGSFQGSGGGVLSIGGQLTGNSASVVATTGTVQVDGGGISGTFASATGTGLSFTSNPNNYINDAVVNGNLTFGSGAFAQVVNGGNQFNGVTTFSGGNARLYDGNAVLSIGSGGTLQGYGLLDQSYGGTTLTNNGTINANSSGNTLAINTSNLTGTGTFQATNGGVLSVGGLWTGNSASVVATTGTVQVDGGGISGTFASATGTGLSFTSNPNNYINDAVVNGNLTFGSGAFAQVVNGGNQFNGVTTFSGGNARLYDGNAVLTIGSGGTLQGYGLLDQSYGGTTLTNNGTINANASGQTLAIGTSNITGTGSFQGSGGGVLSIGGFLNGTNITVLAGATAADGIVQIDGGGLGGSIGSTTGSGLSFTSNPNNNINNAVIGSGATLTFGSGGFAQVVNGGNQFNGVTTFSGGNARLYDGNAVLSIGSGGTLQGYGLLDQSYGGTTLTNNGTINANSSGNTLAINTSNLTGTGTFQATNGGVLSVGGLWTSNSASVVATTGTVQVDGGGISGTFASATGTGLSFTSNPNNYINDAVVNGNLTFGSGAFAQVVNGGNQFNGVTTFSGGNARLYDGNAVLTIGSGGTLQGYGLLDQSYGGTTLTNNGTINANSSGNTLAIGTSNFTNNGTTAVTNNSTLVVAPNAANTGNIQVASGSTANFNGGVTQTAGQTTLDGTASTNGLAFNLQGGSLVGDGALTGPLNNTGGTVSPGSLTAAGHLTVNGDYSQDASSQLLIKLGGTIQGSNFDLLSVSNAVALHGTLDVQLINNFTPFVGETFDFLTYQSRTGDFDSILSLNSPVTYSVTYNDTSGIGTIHVLAVPETGTVVSLSILLCGTGLALRRLRRQSEEEEKRSHSSRQTA